MQLPPALSLPSSRTLRTRLRPLVVLGAVAGGAYALVGTAVRVLQESQQRLADERRDRENLKRRFAQNQDDVSFTVLALLPTLAEQLWAQMDVEAVTASLQQGRKLPAPAQPQQIEQPAARQEEPEVEPYATTNGAAEQGAQAEPDARTDSPAAVDAGAEASDAAPAAAEPSAPVEGAAAAATDSEPAASAAASAPLEAQPSSDAAPAAAASAVDVDVAAAAAADTASQPADAAAAPGAEAAAAAADVEAQPEALPKKLRSLSASAAAFVPKGMAQPPALPQEVLSEGKEMVEDKVETLQQEQAQAQGGQGEKPHLNGDAPADEAAPDEQPASEAVGGSALDSIAEPPPPAIPADARLAPPSAAEQRSSGEAAHDAAASTNGTEAPLSNGVAAHEAEADTTAEREDSSPPTPPAVPELNEEEKKEQLRREQRAKLELWNELRIVSISRTLTSLYALVLLTLQTSVQLNVLGRRAYLDSVSALYPRAAPSAPSDGPHQIRLEPGGAGTGADGWGRLDEEEEEKERKETEQLFLTFSWWFLHRGWEEIAALVRESVGEVFGSLPLKTPLSHADFLAHLADVRRRIEYDGDAEAGGLGASMMSDVRSERSGLSSMRRGKRRNFATALYPAGEEAELDVLVRAGAVTRDSSRIPAALRALLDETRDVLESRDFRRVLRLSLSRVFAELDEALRPAFGVAPPKPPGVPSMTLERFREVEEEEEEGKRVRLAALLPAIARQSQLILCAVPNTYAEALADLNELKAWSAIVYTAWDR